jgi:putative sigma-54 modulation protein
MNIKVTFRHLDSDESLREYAEQKIGRLKKYFHRPVESNVIFSLEKFRHNAEITITADQNRFTGTETASDPMSAFDLCLDKVEIQARRYRDKMKRHRVREENISEPDTEFPPGEQASATHPEIIKTDRYIAKPLSMEDALLLLRDNDDDFLVFRDADSEKVTVLYKRKDGNFGLIEPD